MKQIFLIFLIFIISIKFTYSAEKPFSANISNYNPCDNSVTTTKSNDFIKGDLVLIIQMNGAIIDRSNTENYGDIIDLNGAGQFELNEILSVESGNLKLKYKIKDGYDFSAVIQFIKVPKVKNLTISQQPVVKSWDGETGGVLVLYAEDTLTLETDIDVSGKGFRGGVLYDAGYDFEMLEKEYFYKSNTDKAANKGEGIAFYDFNYGAGKGKNANGGGGGNAADAGGGGGGNLSFGGRGGGPTTYHLIQRNYLEMGLGGGLKTKNDNFYPLILGGGGGAGATNHNFGTEGGRGGGIILLFTKILNGNNHTIFNNGEDVIKVSGSDGAGGGGGGGSIFINYEKCVTPIFTELKRGKGGNTNAQGFNQTILELCIGPGGGGGGGTLYLNKESLFIKSELYGGQSGIMIDGQDTCVGTSYLAADGEIGKRIIPKYEINQDTIKPIKFNFVLVGVGKCNDFKSMLEIFPKDSIKQILWSNGVDKSQIEINKVGNYYAEIIDINGCSHFLDTNITELNISSNYDYTDEFTNDKFVFSGLPETLPKGILLTENKSNEIGAIWQIEKLNLTKDFTTSFGFRVYNGFNNFMFEKSFPGADGFALIFQNNKPNPIGNNGGGIGYTGIPNSLAVELDLFGNYLNLDSIFDPNGNHLAIFSNKAQPNISNHKSDALIQEKLDIIEILGDSSVYFFNLDYLNKKLRVSISKDSLDFSNSIEIDNFDFSKYISLDQNEYSYIGISSATGTAVQTHEILNWSLCGDTKFLNTSIEYGEQFDEILFYPNPVDDLLYINNNFSFKSITITNLLGKIVYQLDDNQNNLTLINVETLEPGIYFVEYINILGESNYTKFIKK